MTPPAAATTPRATIVMTARERHALTERSIASILAHMRSPVRLIYADGATPAPLMDRLAQRASRGELEIVDPGREAWPTHARRQALGRIDSDYVVFVDNDVVVEPGWLDALVTCADETGAGAVGPRYVAGAGGTGGALMPVGAGSWWSSPCSGTWNDADMKKMVRSCCLAVDRRTEKDRPSRIRSTWNVIGTVGSPGRTK